MIRIYTFLVCCLGCLPVYAQDPTPDRWIDSGNETLIDLPAISDGRTTITKSYNTSNPNSFNELLRLKVNYSGNEFLSFRNATTSANNFIPALFAYNQTETGSSMMLIGVTNYAYDVSSAAPLIAFNARKYYDNSLSTGGGELMNRPLFAWSNYTTVHMLMKANGYLGLGTQSPTAQLHTTAGVRFSGLTNGTGSAIVMADTEGNLSTMALPTNSTIPLITNTTVNTVPRFVKSGTLSSGQIVDDGTGVGVGGNPASGSKLTLYGTLKLMSDVRTKTNVRRMGNALQKVNALNGYYYAYKNQPDGREVGFLAQEVEQVLPEAVSENSDGLKFLNYDGVLPLLTEAIKEQQKLIESQSALIKQLRQEVDALKRKL